MKPQLRLAALLATASLAAGAAGWAIPAQPPTMTPPAPAPSESPQPPASEVPPGVPVIQAPPAEGSAQSDNEASSTPAVNRAQAKASPPTPPPAPPPPPLPARSPAAILQVLDKVTAETMRFAAPVGQRVRYKNLVFTVKSCQTSGLTDPSPQASAYVVVDFRPLAVEGLAATPAKQVFRGWMFAESPGLHPLQHPTYDAWLIACMAAAPPA